MRRGNYAAGAMMASFAAGPAFCASLALALWATESPGTVVLDLELGMIGAFIGTFFAALMFGFVLSIIPNIAGSWFMHGLGIGNFAVRLPVAWALVGAGAAGLPFVFFPGLGSALVPVGTAFAITGASCALVANRFATWT